jgi:hypothetical protein
LADATIEKLTRATEQTDAVNLDKRIRFIGPRTINSLSKIAAAAVLLIIVGYAAGRLSAPTPPDIEQIQATLEPAIREQLLGEVKQYLQLGLASCYVRLKDDLSQQYRSDLNQYAAQTLAASGAVTNQLLEELIESINAAQAQDRQWVAAALEQIESNRIRDNAQFSNALVGFADQTEEELLRTKQDLAQMLSFYTQPDSSIPKEFENSNNYNERNKK